MERVACLEAAVEAVAVVGLEVGGLGQGEGFQGTWETKELVEPFKTEVTLDELQLSEVCSVGFGPADQFVKSVPRTDMRARDHQLFQGWMQEDGRIVADVIQ